MLQCADDILGLDGSFAAERTLQVNACSRGMSVYPKQHT